MAKIVRMHGTDNTKNIKGKHKKLDEAEEKLLNEMEIFNSGMYYGRDMTVKQLYDKIKSIKDFHGAGKKPYRILSVNPKEVVIRDVRYGEELTIPMDEFAESLCLDSWERTATNLKHYMPVKHASAVAALFWHIADQERWGVARQLIREMFEGMIKK